MTATIETAIRPRAKEEEPPSEEESLDFQIELLNLRESIEARREVYYALLKKAYEADCDMYK